jgi:hypothetical protein
VNVIEGLSVNHVSVDRRSARNCFGCRLHPYTERYSELTFKCQFAPCWFVFITPSDKGDSAGSSSRQ